MEFKLIEKGNGDYSDFMKFIKIIHNTTDEEFESRITTVFDVDRYLKLLAVDAWTGHWDGYSGNGNNYALYFNPLTDKFEVCCQF